MPRGRPKPKGPNAGVRKRRIVDKGFDAEQTHLALALSISEAVTKSQNYATKPSQELKNASNGPKPEINAFSVLMTPKVECKKRRKKINSHHLASILAKTSEQQRLFNLSQKVSFLVSLESSQDYAKDTGAPFQASLQKFQVTEDIQRLWNIDCADLKPGVLDCFYVEKLQPFVEISRIVVGSKIKEMGHIPGWKPLAKTDMKSATKDIEVDRTTIANQTLANSTAYILAQLADDESMSHSDSHLNASQLPLSEEHNKTGFISKKQTEFTSEFRQNQSREKLAMDMLKLVDDPVGSDVQLVCRDGEILQAHTPILKMRCPLLLEHVKQGCISLKTHSLEAVKTVVKFVYGGLLDVNEKVAQEVQSLSEKFNLPLLSEICNELTSQSKDAVDATQSHRLVDKTLQDLLHGVWSSDSESESDSQSDTRNNPSEADYPHKSAASNDLPQEDLHSDLDSDTDRSDADDSVSSDKTNNNISGKYTFGATLLCKLEESFMCPDAMDMDIF